MVTNRRIVEKNSGPDFYPTPTWGTKALIQNETFEGNILEPCCGSGDMAEVLKETGNAVLAYDKYDHGYGGVRDFFDVKETYPNVVTNPPFNIAEDILEHAFDVATDKICLLLRLAFLESKRRYKKFYHNNPPSRVWVFSERLSMYPKGSVVNGGGTTSYAWFVWDKAFWAQKTTELYWIKPGLKE